MGYPIYHSPFETTGHRKTQAKMLDMFSKASIELFRLNVSAVIYLIALSLKNGSEIKLVWNREQKAFACWSLSTYFQIEHKMHQTHRKLSHTDCGVLQSDIHNVLGHYIFGIVRWTWVENSACMNKIVHCRIMFFRLFIQTGFRPACKSANWNRYDRWWSVAMYERHVYRSGP